MRRKPPANTLEVMLLVLSKRGWRCRPAGKVIWVEGTTVRGKPRVTKVHDLRRPLPMGWDWRSVLFDRPEARIRRAEKRLFDRGAVNERT